jgi:hypothetical protein
MNYILEVYSHGMFIPITGNAVCEPNKAVTLEFGIDDNFNNPDWMTTNIYKIEGHHAILHTVSETMQQQDPAVETFLFDAKRDIMTHLDATGFFASKTS